VSLRGTGRAYPDADQRPSCRHRRLAGHHQTSNVGRSVSYALLPSELVARSSSTRARRPSWWKAAAGTIDIRTRKPLDFNKDFTGEATLGAVYSDLPGKTEPQFSGLFNYKNADGTSAFWSKPSTRARACAATARKSSAVMARFPPPRPPHWPIPIWQAPITRT
jgi:iron complex outermembrane receptor protein